MTRCPCRASPHPQTAAGYVCPLAHEPAPPPPSPPPPLPPSSLSKAHRADGIDELGKTTERAKGYGASIFRQAHHLRSQNKVGGSGGLVRVDGLETAVAVCQFSQQSYRTCGDWARRATGCLECRLTLVPLLCIRGTRLLQEFPDTRIFH